MNKLIYTFLISALVTTSVLADAEIQVRVNGEEGFSYPKPLFVEAFGNGLITQGLQFKKRNTIPASRGPHHLYAFRATQEQNPPPGKQVLCYSDNFDIENDKIYHVTVDFTQPKKTHQSYDCSVTVEDH
jgi:hypothetical protein